jgi:phage tail-like protein
MSDLFPANPNRVDPYKNYAFHVFLGDNAAPAAGVHGVGPVRRYTDVIEYREGGSALTLKVPGRTHYDPVVLTKGITHDAEFEVWANAVQVLTGGNPSTSLANLRKNISIVLLNEERQPVRRYLFYRCWVSEYQALPFLDAGTSATTFEHITIENEGWERDTALSEPQEQ